ncbi:helix-turn-helix domain-containing protein [Streptomyces sparsogenes]|uniref:nSTAND1 domain-containing NTPase n=1 Tax=Streptomyces sparsogenes TaxID=67365 RepID=UPI0033C61405
MGRRENPLDASAGPVAELALELRRLRHEAGSPPYSEMARHCAYSAATLSRAAAGKQLPTLAVLLAYVEVCGGRAFVWEERWLRVSEALTARHGDHEPPYKGLARFEYADRDLYFGRERLADDLLTLVREQRVVTLFGPSGSGKSSLLRAGLVPRLRHAEGGPRPAAIRILTPGERPLATHRPLLSPVDTRAPEHASADTYLIVDQFEEFFTLCHDLIERRGFVEALLAARRPDSRLRVVLGIRADFYARCLEHPGLAAAIRDASLPMTRMNPAELREAIVKPAAARRLVVERALTARLAHDVADDGLALPLLSHALLETWHRRRGRTLTLDSYERAGGMRGAIAQSAEGVYARLDPSQADTARRIMLRMITPGEGNVTDTRRSTTRTELEATGKGGEANKVLETLARARLITLDATTATLAHESLISAWPRLRGWVEQDREKLRFQRWLTEAADAWEAVGRDPGVRISPVRLAQFDTFASLTDRGELTGLEADFLAAGMATHRRTIRSRAMVPLLVATTALAAAIAWKQQRLLQKHRLP